MRYRVGLVDEFSEGKGRELVVAGRIVAVFRTANGFHAIDGICAHAGGPLAQGMLRGSVVTCPWHGWQFDVCTGRHQLNPRVGVEAFTVTVEDGAVFVEVPEGPAT